MEHVKGSVRDGDEVLHEDLDIALNLVEAASGSKLYMGCFQVPHEPAALKSEGPFQLHLEDGRVGFFKSPRLQARESGVKVSFTLSGVPKKGKGSRASEGGAGS